MSSPAPIHEISRAASLNQKLRLERVTMLNMAATRALMLPQGGESPLRFQVIYEHPAYEEAPQAIIAIHTLHVRLEAVTDGSAQPLGEVRVATRADYHKADGFTDADSPAIADYVGITAWMHVWPYLRAEIQSLTAKLDLPPLLLPVLFAGQLAHIPVTRLSSEPAPREAPARVSRPAAKRALKPKQELSKSAAKGRREPKKRSSK